MKLSSQQVAQFREQGYLIAPNILTDADLQPVMDEISTMLDRRARELQEMGLIDDLAEGESFETRFSHLRKQTAEIGKNLDIMQAKAPAMFRFLRNDNLLDAVESLIGPEIICSPIQHLRAKFPDRLREDQSADYYHNVPWHQDAGVTLPEADPSDIITCWIPLVDATYETGCMQIMPQVWKKGLLDHQAEGGTTIVPEQLPDQEPVCAACPKGGVVFMHKYTPHRGQTNHTDWTVRWTIDLRYQPTGTPTGRPFHPSFVVRSRHNPDSVLTDHATWCKMWDDALEAYKRNPIRMHRVIQK